MYTGQALLDIHERTHASFEKVIAHFEGISEDELSRELVGFGYATALEQIRHIIGSEYYWISVARGIFTEEMMTTIGMKRSLTELKVYCKRTAAATRTYIESLSNEALNRPTAVTVYGGAEHELKPALIVMRTQTHIFQHIGQLTAIARTLGRPVEPGMDFSVR